MLILDPHCLDKFPLLKEYHQRMIERPKLKVTPYPHINFIFLVPADIIPTLTFFKAWCEKRNAADVKVNGNGKQ